MQLPQSHKSKIHRPVGNLLAEPPLGAGGLVLRASWYRGNIIGGKDLAIGIACLTKHYPLEPEEKYTHTCTHTHHHRLLCHVIPAWQTQLNNQLGVETPKLTAPMPMGILFLLFSGGVYCQFSCMIPMYSYLKWVWAEHRTSYR